MRRGDFAGHTCSCQSRHWCQFGSSLSATHWHHPRSRRIFRGTVECPGFRQKLIIVVVGVGDRLIVAAGVVRLGQAVADQVIGEGVGIGLASHAAGISLPRSVCRDCRSPTSVSTVEKTLPSALYCVSFTASRRPLSASTGAHSSPCDELLRFWLYRNAKPLLQLSLGDTRFLNPLQPTRFGDRLAFPEEHLPSVAEIVPNFSSRCILRHLLMLQL